MEFGEENNMICRLRYLTLFKTLLLRKKHGQDCVLPLVGELTLCTKEAQLVQPAKKEKVLSRVWHEKKTAKPHKAFLFFITFFDNFSLLIF